MKRIFLLFIILTAALSIVSADRAFWSGIDSGLVAHSDKYVSSSTLLITYGDKSTKVKVTAPVSPTLYGRELGLSRTALEALGIWGMGDTDVKVDLVKGELVQSDEKDESGSGWYSITLLPIIKGYALEKYEILTKNGFKPRTEVVDSRYVFTIPYVAEYEKDDTLTLLSNLGFLVDKTEETENPYL